LLEERDYLVLTLNKLLLKTSKMKDQMENMSGQA